MRQRCRDPNSISYPKYGGKGIKVCPAWDNSFEAFLLDMGVRPAGTTLDRKDPRGDYTPSNCRWATPKQQSENSDNHAKGWKRDKTHCPAGHEYSSANLRVTRSGHRQCKTCANQQRRDRRKAGAKN